VLTSFGCRSYVCGNHKVNHPGPIELRLTLRFHFATNCKWGLLIGAGWFFQLSIQGFLNHRVFQSLFVISYQSLAICPESNCSEPPANGKCWYRPVKSGLSAAKFMFFRKFIELITAKFPIYTTGTEVNAGVFAGLKLRLCNFLPIEYLFAICNLAVQADSFGTDCS